MMMMTMKTLPAMGTVISKLLCLMMVVLFAIVANPQGIHAKKNHHGHHRNKIMGSSSSSTTTIATPSRRRRQSVKQHRIDNHIETSTGLEFEFGRSSSSSSSSINRLLQEVMDKEDIYRSMLEVDFSVSMSSSMSIVVPFPTNRPNSPPPTDEPTGSFEPSESLEPTVEPTATSEPSESVSAEPTDPIITERTAPGPCDGEPDRTTTVLMEAVLAPGTPVNEYTADLDEALTKALASEYPLCEAIVRVRRQRALQSDEMYIGAVNVIDAGSECRSQTGTCRNVQIDVEQYGGTGQEDIIDFIKFTIAENEDFDYEIKQDGISSVRVVNESVNESNSPTTRSSTSSEESLNAGTTAVVVVASLAAVTLIVAAVMRRGSLTRQNGMAYVEAFDEYDCKSVDQASESQHTYEDTLPFAASVDSTGVLGAVRRDYMPAKYLPGNSPDSPRSELRKRPSSP